MKYYIYHTLFDFNKRDRKSKYIWVCSSLDAKVVYEHLSKYLKNDNFYIEEKLLKVFNTDVESFKIDELNKQDNNNLKIAFFVQSDTLVHSAINLLDKDKNRYSFYVPKYFDERAQTALKSYNISYNKFSIRRILKNKPDYIILFNDWGIVAKWIISLCRLLSISSIVIQESVIDFNKRKGRMTFADLSFVQGSQTIMELDRSLYFIIGNPRYENLGKTEIAKDRAIVNCNFTYGIFEFARKDWLDDIVYATDKAGINYAISQHPRDTGNLSNYKNVMPSSASVVHNQIAESRVLITRFSSLIHESLIMGIPVIYYNPHGESMDYNFEFNNEFLFYAEDKESLTEILKRVLVSSLDNESIKKYIGAHCLPIANKPSSNFLYLLDNLNITAAKCGIFDYLKLIFYNPFTYAVARFIIKRTKSLINLK